MLKRKKLAFSKCSSDAACAIATTVSSYVLGGAVEVLSNDSSSNTWQIGEETETCVEDLLDAMKAD